MKKLTRKDIAKAAEVSPSTVSRALSESDLLPQETIDRIKKIAKKMGYQPNVLARRFSSNQSRRVGYVIPKRTTRKGPLQVSYFSTILDSMVQTASENKYDISIYTYDKEGPELINFLAGKVYSKEVDGLVFVGLRQDSRIPNFLKRKQIPSVLIGNCYEKGNARTISCDPFSAHLEMFGTLKEKEYKRMFFVHGDLGYYHAQAQRDSLRKAAREAKFPIAKVFHGNYTRASGYIAAEKIMKIKEDGDCVFLANDRMATGFYRFCYENKISIPDEIGVIGSDNDEAATALFPNLTTINQPRMAMGRQAVVSLIKRLNGKRIKSIVLEKQFILKDSI